MQTLHIITPSHFTTSDEMFGLMRLAQKSMAGEHRTVVIGNQHEASALRQRGIRVLGSIDGALDVSKTLTGRLQRILLSRNCNKNLTCLAWGWNAAAILSTVSSPIDTFAFVDEVDDSCEYGKNELLIIPTGWSCSQKLASLGIDTCSIAEPLLGVEPSSMVLDRKTVFDTLNISSTKQVIVIIGKRASWQTILSVLFRMDTREEDFVFVLPAEYCYSSVLRSAVKQRGLLHRLLDLPVSLRTPDVLTVATCAWAPEPASYDSSHSVLEIVAAAWCDTPVAASVRHPISKIPCFGPQIAWYESELDLSGWLFDAIENDTTLLQKSAEVTMSVRSIASPSRFIEGIQLRMSTQSVM